MSYVVAESVSQGDSKLLAAEGWYTGASAVLVLTTVFAELFGLYRTDSRIHAVSLFVVSVCFAYFVHKEWTIYKVIKRLTASRLILKLEEWDCYDVRKRYADWSNAFGHVWFKLDKSTRTQHSELTTAFIQLLIDEKAQSYGFHAEKFTELLAAATALLDAQEELHKAARYAGDFDEVIARAHASAQATTEVTRSLSDRDWIGLERISDYRFDTRG